MAQFNTNVKQPLIGQNHGFSTNDSPFGSGDFAPVQYSAEIPSKTNTGEYGAPAGPMSPRNNPGYGVTNNPNYGGMMNPPVYYPPPPPAVSTNKTEIIVVNAGATAPPPPPPQERLIIYEAPRIPWWRTRICKIISGVVIIVIIIIIVSSSLSAKK